MKNKEYFVSKYENRMDEIHREALEEGISKNSIDGYCAMEFDQTANAEEIAGYYLVSYEGESLKVWLENTAGLVLTEQDKEVTQILTVLHEKEFGKPGLDNQIKMAESCASEPAEKATILEFER